MFAITEDRSSCWSSWALSTVSISTNSINLLAGFPAKNWFVPHLSYLFQYISSILSTNSISLAKKIRFIPHFSYLFQSLFLKFPLIYETQYLTLFFFTLLRQKRTKKGFTILSIFSFSNTKPNDDFFYQSRFLLTVSVSNKLL